MIHRDAPGSAQADYHAGKWNGLGGKCEADESAFETASREFEEEAGIKVAPSRMTMIGVLQFPNFKAHKNEDWTVFVFETELTSGERAQVHAKSDEGSLHWIVREDVMKLRLWPGDQHFLPYVIRREPFFGTLWYEGQNVSRHEVRALSGA
jgi:8-oxo-dGTP diphosphatase